MTLLAGAYAAYNDRDVDGLLARVTADVDWPDGTRRLHGRAAVRAYWFAQWDRLRTHDEPVAFRVLDGGGADVRVEQTVHDLDGSPISRGTFVHTFRFADGRIARLDIHPVPP